MEVFSAATHPPIFLISLHITPAGILGSMARGTMIRHLVTALSSQTMSFLIGEETRYTVVKAVNTILSIIISKQVLLRAAILQTAALLTNEIEY